MIDPGEVTRLLEAAASGDGHALDRLVPMVYAELERISRGQLARERFEHTLNTGALVHEAYIKLVGLERIEWRGRAHFFAVAAGAMRRILIDHALARRALKRGGGTPASPLDGIDAPALSSSLDDLLAVNEALDELRELDARQATVVEYRFFGGMTIEEVAEALDVSTMTVKRDWTVARAWLNRELSA